ncbi:Ger(x)C family spore germination protein [Fredinandcohnia sp. QZ13]|uniref:Ger(x)C family spore germination protein n=1 Tax=Fredinandcohnia sp. QZ13 TaxID=3073144 RepID=UPI0028533F99|nr:Ger(x)C family spore germination protein [Fredinandcohnia sp. QZ13]MDR4886018.1 Ger(x)C family spore germination protein [Fredinandcohnia sp. QZ13]
MLKKKLAVVLMLPLLLSACWDNNEIDKVLYIHALGVDYKEGEYQVYAQLINIGGLGRSEGGGGIQTSPSTVGMGKGNTVDSAVFDFYKNVPQRIFWGHLSSMVFTEDALKQQNIVLSAMDVINRYRETRYTVWISSTNSSIRDLLNTFPILGISPMFTRLSDPRTSYEQSSFVEPKRFQKFLIELNEPAHTSAIPRLELLDNYWLEKDNSLPAYRINGINIYSKNGYKGKLVGEQIEGLSWIKEGERISVFPQKDGYQAASIVFSNVKTKIKPKIENGSLTFTVEVKAKGTITELNQELSEAEINQLAKEQIASYIKTTYLAALEKETDLYRVTETIYRKDPQSWKKITNNGRTLPLTNESLKKITIKSKIQSSGKQKLKKT